MYDNSELIQYDSSITFLYLYDNATASLFGSSYMNEIYMDPASTALVKLYAYETTFFPLDQYNDPLGPGNIQGKWSSNDMPFNIQLIGQGAYSQHVQIIPEPATLFLLGLGAAFLRKRK